MSALDINPNTSTITTRRKLRKSGSSTVVTLAPEMLQMLDWHRGDEVEIEADWDAGEITIALG